MTTPTQPLVTEPLISVPGGWHVNHVVTTGWGWAGGKEACSVWFCWGEWGALRILHSVSSGTGLGTFLLLTLLYTRGQKSEPWARLHTEAKEPPSKSVKPGWSWGLPWAEGLCPLPPNSGWNLIPKVMVFGGGALWSWPGMGLVPL